LLGSRARGDASPDSDYDLAFGFDASNRDAWIRFKADAEESSLTLKRIDWVDLAEATPELRERVMSEGKLLYGKK
jgi:predicted nucleotidyltransferase